MAVFVGIVLEAGVVVAPVSLGIALRTWRPALPRAWSRAAAVGASAAVRSAFYTALCVITAALALPFVRRLA
jgi:hypothetical protein